MALICHLVIGSAFSPVNEAHSGSRSSIFRADRPSTDDDAIAQDPMQVAMKAAIEENQRYG